jgi:MFS transporter, DHA3 family, macrolide efflux protein
VSDGLHPMMDSSFAPVRHGKSNLVLLWAGQFISAVGDQFFATSANMLVLTLALQEGSTGASAKAGLMGAMRAAPSLLFGLVGGVIADRFDRRRLMIVADLVRAAVLVGAWHAWHAGRLSWWMLPVAAFLCYSFSTIFDPARDALLPEIAEGAPLLRINSAFQSSTQAAFLFGGLIAGLLGIGIGGGRAELSAGTLTLLISIDGLTFAASAVLLLAIRPPRSARATRARPSALTDLKDVAALAFRDARLRTLLMLTAGNNLFIMGPATVGAVLLFQRERGTGFGEYAFFGLVMSVGFLLGTACVVRLGARWAKGRLLLVGMVIDGLTFLPFALFGKPTPLWLLLVAGTVHGIFIPWITVARTSIIQSYYPAEIRGRIFACVGLTATGFMALSAAATGILGEWLSTRWLFLISGSGGALMGVLGLATCEALRQTE